MDINLENITVRLPSDGVVLFKIEKFKIPFGAKILITGPSGKGKTTLLHLIAGLFLADEGNVYLGNKNLKFLSDKERSNMRRKHFSIVFQKLNLLDHLTVMENVFLGINSCNNSGQGTVVQNVYKVLQNVGMENLMNRKCAYLSLGEQQRVAIARVAISDPKIILADEPTSSLDEQNAKLVISSLLTTSRNKTLVVVSHDQRIKSSFPTVIDFMDLIQS